MSRLVAPPSDQPGPPARVVCALGWSDARGGRRTGETYSQGSGNRCRVRRGRGGSTEESCASCGPRRAQRRRRRGACAPATRRTRVAETFPSKRTARRGPPQRRRPLQQGSRLGPTIRSGCRPRRRRSRAAPPGNGRPRYRHRSRPPGPTRRAAQGRQMLRHTFSRRLHAVHASPCPHEAFDVGAVAGQRQVEERRFILRRRHARERPHLGVGDLPVLHGHADARQSSRRGHRCPLGERARGRVARRGCRGIPRKMR